MIALLVLAAAVQRPAVLTPQRVRYELVYQMAKRICPSIERSGMPHTLQTVLIASNQLLRGRTVLTGGEVVMLIEDCSIYVQGMNDAR